MNVCAKLHGDGVVIETCHSEPQISVCYTYCIGQCSRSDCANLVSEQTSGFSMDRLKDKWPLTIKSTLSLDAHLFLSSVQPFPLYSMLLDVDEVLLSYSSGGVRATSLISAVMARLQD